MENINILIKLFWINSDVNYDFLEYLSLAVHANLKMQTPPNFLLSKPKWIHLLLAIYCWLVFFSADSLFICPSHSVTFLLRRCAPFLIATFWKKANFGRVPRYRHVLATLSPRCSPGVTTCTSFYFRFYGLCLLRMTSTCQRLAVHVKG